MSSLVQLAAGEGAEIRFLDQDSGWVYVRNSSGQLEKLVKMMRGDDEADQRTLADYAAQYDAECISANTRRPVTLRDPSYRSADNPRGERVVNCRHVYGDDGMIVGYSDVRTLALPGGELGPGDVHIDRGLPNIAQGYTLAEGVADLASAPLIVPNQSDKFWTWSEKNAFTQVVPIMSAAGGATPEVQGSLSTTSFQCKPYVLGTFIPSELQANADAPLNVMQKFMRIVMDKLKLAREIRVQTTLGTTGNWNTNLVNTVPAANKWNNGASADPIADLMLAIEQSYMAPTDIVMSELLFHWFQRSPAVQKYFYAKDGAPQLPTPEQASAMFGLPKITVAKMKYLPTASGAITYVWGNDAYLLRSTAALASQQDAASTRTFRWSGGPTPDGSAVGGWLVRTYFDQKRGPRGGTAVVVSHYDDDSLLTSNLVGGLVHTAYQ